MKNDVFLSVLSMDMPGPSADHAESASSHFMFVKRKDETSKEGDIQLNQANVCEFLSLSYYLLGFQRCFRASISR